MSSKKLIRETIFLSLSILFVKFLSIVYRVPYQNIVGDKGFYIYQSVYPIYGIFYNVITFSLPAAFAALVVRTQHNRNLYSQVVTSSILWLTISSIIVLPILFFGSNFIATQMGDPLLANSIKVVSLMALFIPLTAPIRGYFQGKNIVTPNVLSLTLEQLTRVIFILFLSYLFITRQADFYKIGTWAFASALIGSTVSLLILLYFTRKQPELVFKFKTPNKSLLLTTGKILLIHVLSLCTVHLLLLLIQLIDSFLLLNQLIALGYPLQTAKELKGIYDRGQPFIQVGMVFATSIGISSIPLLTAAKTLKNKRETVKLGMRLCIGISLGSTIGIILLIVPLNTLLFRNPDGTEFLRILMLSIFFASIIITSVHMLQVKNNTPTGLLVVLVTLLSKIFLTPFLTEKYVLNGNAYATTLSLMVGAIFSLLLLQLKYELIIFTKKETVDLICAGFILITFLYTYRNVIPWQTYSRVSSLFEMITASILGALIYIFYLCKSRFFKYEDLELFPFGDKLQRFFPKH